MTKGTRVVADLNPGLLQKLDDLTLYFNMTRSGLVRSLILEKHDKVLRDKNI